MFTTQVKQVNYSRLDDDGLPTRATVVYALVRDGNVITTSAVDLNFSRFDADKLFTEIGEWLANTVAIESMNVGESGRPDLDRLTGALCSVEFDAGDLDKKPELDAKVAEADQKRADKQSTEEAAMAAKLEASDGQ